MFALLDPPLRLPPLESRASWEHFDHGLLNARSQKKSHGKSEPKDDDVPSLPNYTNNEPPGPPIGTAVNDEPLPIWEMQMLQSAFLKTMNFLCERPAEAAGVWCMKTR